MKGAVICTLQQALSEPNSEGGQERPAWVSPHSSDIICWTLETIVSKELNQTHR